MSDKENKLQYDLTINQYGFVWGNCLVERTASSVTKPKFQVIRVFCPNGEIVEVQMTPRKVHVNTIPREIKKSK